MIKIDHVAYRYDEEHTALKDISLEINKSEMLAIVGHNGSGKSTLAKHLNALLLPTEGRVEVDGMDTAVEANTLNIRKKVGMVFQNPDNQIVTTIVEEDVAFGPENLGVPPEEIRRRVNEALKAVGMEKYARSAPHMLSGGQKQRIAIAGVVAMKPSCIIFDEPTAMLDPKGRGEIMAIIKELNGEGITVILITHFMEEAVNADRVIIMHEGEVFLDGTPSEVFARGGRVKSVNLDVPLAVELAARLRQRGIEVPADIIGTEEMVEYLCQYKSRT